MRNAGSSHAGTTGNRFTAPPTPGRPDGLGERWSAVAGNDGSPVELLHLRSEVSTAPGFEEALRDRVARVKAFTHPAFAPVRDLYQEDADLALVSARIPGQALADLTARDVPRSKRPAVVARILQQATSALAALERAAPGVTHGALTADRILITPGGAICITEYVFGSALEQLALWPEELFLQFGVLAPAGEDGQAVFDARTTVMQLGAVALSALLERPVTLQDFDHGLEALVEEFVTNASAARHPSHLITPLRTWLRHALQLNDPAYASSAEAEKGLTQALAEAGPEARAEIDAAPIPLAIAPRLVAREEPKREEPKREEPKREELKREEPKREEPKREELKRQESKREESKRKDLKREEPKTVAAPEAAPSTPAAVAVPSNTSSPLSTPSIASAASPTKAFSSEAPFVAPTPFRPPPSPVLPQAPFVPSPVPPVETEHAAPPYLKWAIAALAVVAIGEAAFIARLLTQNQPVPAQASVTIESSQPGTTVMVDGRPAGATPLKLDVTGQSRAIRVIPSETAASTAPAVAPPPVNTDAAKTAAELEQAAARQKSGGVTFVSSIPLDVFEGERVLGSTSSGPIVASAGPHSLDLVNTALGFRMRQAVTIRAGTIARVPITLPMGRLSINAQPWAQVLIDDNAVGETPLANVPAAIGEHQITFRHPQFGERKERVIVRADTPARVSTTFQR